MTDFEKQIITYALSRLERETLMQIKEMANGSNNPAARAFTEICKIFV